MIYADAFILYEYHGNVGFWVWWWSAGVKFVLIFMIGQMAVPLFE